MTSDINDRIALAKGWRLSKWYEDSGVLGTRSETPLHIHWYNPAKEIADRPDYTGTVWGVSLMLQELQEKTVEEDAIQYDWAVRWSALFQIWDVWAEDAYNTGERLVTAAATKEAGLGEAVGVAWLSEFEKEAADANTAD